MLHPRLPEVQEPLTTPTTMNRQHEHEKAIGQQKMSQSTKLEQATIIARHYTRFASYMQAIARMIQAHADTPESFKALPGNPLPSAIEEICDRALSDLAKDFRLTFGIDLPHYQFPPDTQTTPAQPVPSYPPTFQGTIPPAYDK